MNYIGYIKKLLRQPIGAMPVGLKVKLANVVLGFERQLEIDGKVRLDVVSDRKKIVSIDGVVKNKPMQIKKLTNFILKSDNFKWEESKDVNKYIEGKVKELVNNLSKEVKDFNSPKKTSAKKTSARKTTTRKVSLDKQGFLIRSTSDGFVKIPKTKFTVFKSDKLPKVKFFVGKVDGIWYVFELTTGKSVANGFNKKDVIDQAKKVINKLSVNDLNKMLKQNILPKEQLDIVMRPYKKSTSRVATKPVNKSTARKVTPKKAAKRSKSKGNAGNLVYVGKGTKGNKKVYQYAYKKIKK